MKKEERIVKFYTGFDTNITTFTIDEFAKEFVDMYFDEMYDIIESHNIVDNLDEMSDEELVELVKNNIDLIVDEFDNGEVKFVRTHVAIDDNGKVLFPKEVLEEFAERL